MSGVSIRVEMADLGARAAFERLARAIADTTPIMRAIGTALIEGTQDRIEREVTPDGAPFAPLNPDYAAIKRGPGILRESAMRGGLIASITQQAGRDQVTVGTNKIYAAIHQLGGVIKPKSASHLVFKMAGGVVRAASVTIPARPYLGISAEDQDSVLDILEGALARRLAAG